MKEIRICQKTSCNISIFREFNNMFEDFKGVLRDELLAIDFHNDMEDANVDEFGR